MAYQILANLISSYFKAYFVNVLLFTILWSKWPFFPLFSEYVTSNIVPYYLFFLLYKKFFTKIFALHISLFYSSIGSNAIVAFPGHSMLTSTSTQFQDILYQICIIFIELLSTYI